MIRPPSVNHSHETVFGCSFPAFSPNASLQIRLRAGESNADVDGRIALLRTD
jgi:hypothetical protein